MATRKIVVVGDKTTTGGVILPNVNSTFSLGDAAHKAALIGGPVQCPACKSNGVIAKAGGPRRMNFMGEVALENDIVLCGCSTPPKLVADLHHTMTYDDGAACGVAASPALLGSSQASFVKHRENVQADQIKADHKAAIREAIIAKINESGHTFVTREAWKAEPGKTSDGPDWDYHGIALHHAGNSFSCEAGDFSQIRKAEKIDFKTFGHISYHYAVACDGMIFEALDIRSKGAHIAHGNTGIIGIVMLADLSFQGEAYKQEYANKSWFGKMDGIFQWGSDRLDVLSDEPTEEQIKALFVLVKTLREFFPISMLGGHREYQQLFTNEGRACPGSYGMVLVNMLRSEYKIGEPQKP